MLLVVAPLSCCSQPALVVQNSKSSLHSTFDILVLSYPALTVPCQAVEYHMSCMQTLSCHLLAPRIGA